MYRLDPCFFLLDHGKSTPEKCYPTLYGSGFTLRQDAVPRER